MISPDGPSRLTVAISLAAVGNGFVFTYTRSRAASQSGHVYQVELSDDMSPPWTSLGSGAVKTDGTSQVMEVPVPAEAADRCFLRLKVTAP